MACSVWFVEGSDASERLVRDFIETHDKSGTREVLDAVDSDWSLISELDLLDDCRDILADGREFDIITTKASALTLSGACWDEDHFDVFIYVPRLNGFFRIDKLTDRALKPANNVHRLYFAHEFERFGDAVV